MGGRKTEGERNPQLLSEPMKSSNLIFYYRAEDVTDSKARGGPRDQVCAHRGLCMCKECMKPWTSLILEQNKPPHVKGRVQVSHYSRPCLHFPLMYDNHAMHICANFQLLSKRIHTLKHSFAASTQQDIVSYLHKSQYSYSELRNTSKTCMLITLHATPCHGWHFC